MTAQPICFIDTETDGLHAGRQVWEIAIIKRITDYELIRAREELTLADDPEHEILHVFVDLPSMRASDQYALRLGGFWDRHPAGRALSGKVATPAVAALISQRAAARKVAEFTHGAHIVGVNPSFDTETLASLLRTEGLVPQWDYHLEDLVAETVGYLRARHAGHPNPSIPTGSPTTDLPWKSDELAAAVGVEPAPEEDRHTALGDARWAQRWHDTLTGRELARPAGATA